MVGGLLNLIQAVYQNHPTLRTDAQIDAAVDALTALAGTKTTAKAQLKLLRSDVQAKRPDQGRRRTIATLDPLT